jgi:RNA polymerase sigma-70 factor, ECF subfamily
MCNETASRYTSCTEDSRYARAVHAPSFAEPVEDAALARAIAAAAPRIDAGAEAELCRRLAPRVRLYGLRHLRDSQAAADLSQEVLLITLQRLRAGELRQPEKLVSFVLGTCRMLVLELRRGAARREGLLRTYGEPDGALEPDEPTLLDSQRLSRCMDALTERERSVLVLSFYGDSSAHEVARELAMTPGNARVIRHRALERVRRCLEPKGARP